MMHGRLAWGYECCSGRLQTASLQGKCATKGINTSDAAGVLLTGVDAAVAERPLPQAPA